MSPTLVIRPQAEADMAEAFAWYEAQRAGLGAELIAEVRVALERLQKGPERFPVCYRNIRRAPVRRFPYSIYYLVSGGAVIVLAVLHHRRNPDAWRKRPREG